MISGSDLLETAIQLGDRSLVTLFALSMQKDRDRHGTALKRLAPKILDLMSREGIGSIIDPEFFMSTIDPDGNSVYKWRLRYNREFFEAHLHKTATDMLNSQMVSLQFHDAHGEDVIAVCNFLLCNPHVAYRVYEVRLLDSDAPDDCMAKIGKVYPHIMCSK